MLEPTTILSYLRDVTDLVDTTAAAPSADAPRWVVSYDDLYAGGLSSHTTREMLLAYAYKFNDVAFGDRSIPLLCCLRSLLTDDEGARIPLLCVRAMLDANGTLAPYPESSAWIPQNVIASSEYFNSEFCVCDLDTYCAHAAALSSLPDDGTWTGALTKAVDLFDSVNELTEERLASMSASIDDMTCVLSIWERPDDALDATRMLGRVIPSFIAEDDLALLSGPLRKLLLEAPAPDEEQDMAEELPDDVLLAPKLLCGIPDYLPSLKPREREAVCTVARQQSGDVLAISAPKGTDSLTVAIAAMANQLTYSALRGDQAPLMACIAPMATIQNVLSLFSNRPITGQVALNSRWMPRISMPGTTSRERADKRTLGPLQALCLVHTADGSDIPPSSQCMRQPYGHAQGGDTALYGDAWYVPKASIYYLDCISSYMDERVQNLGQARMRLSERLRKIDQDRCELIDSYACVCRASELLKRRDGLVARIGRLRRGHTVCRERLRFWENLAQTTRTHKSILGKPAADQEAIIARHAQRGEDLAVGKTTLEDVCAAYRYEILRIETSIDRLRGAAANLTKRIRSSGPEGKKCTEIIRRLAKTCPLDASQLAMLEASIDGRSGEVSMEQLEDVLDCTIRPAEFWLSVHIYEATWLLYRHRAISTMHSGRDATSGAWRGWSALCPFSLIPTDIAVGTVCALTGLGKGRVDLAMVVHADAFDIPRGIAAASASNRLVLLGSVATMGSAPLRKDTFDEIQGTALAGESAWTELKESGIAVSLNMSLYEFVLKKAHIPMFALCDTERSYGELDDLRMDLFPGERLRTNRLPANSADDTEYPLGNVVPSLSYVLVPDSSWVQRGPSRQNRSEVLALGRWLQNHVREILSCYRGGTDAPLVLASPFAAQTRLLAEFVSGLSPAIRARIETRSLHELGEDTWPVVVLCMTCGPDAFNGLGCANAKNVLATIAAAAKDALILFCGGVWMRSHDDVAKAVLKHSTRVGRLFSSPRKAKEDTAQGELVLRTKPLSLTALLSSLKARDEIAEIPSTSEVNKALLKAGLIERVKGADHVGWRPTPAGREIGILATKDHFGHLYCSYTRESEVVIATVVETMG